MEKYVFDFNDELLSKFQIHEKQNFTLNCNVGLFYKENIWSTEKFKFIHERTLTRHYINGIQYSWRVGFREATAFDVMPSHEELKIVV